MSGLTYSPPPPSFSFTLLWGFDDGIQLGQAGHATWVGERGCEPEKPGAPSYHSLRRGRYWITMEAALLAYSLVFQHAGRRSVHYLCPGNVVCTDGAPLCKHFWRLCCPTTSPIGRPSNGVPSSPSHRCSCWSTHWDVDEACIIVGPKFDMLIKLKEDEDLEFIEELTDHAPPKSIKPQKSTMCLSLPLQVRDRRFILDSRSGHDLTSTASARSQWALPDLNRECQISVGS